MKLLYILLTPTAFIYYILRDLPVLLKHPELLRGIKEIIYISLIGILASFIIELWKENKKQREEKLKVIKKIGINPYKWIIK